MSVTSAKSTSHRTAYVDPSGDQRIDGVLGGEKWLGPVSFSDPDDPADYPFGHPESFTEFQPISAGQLLTTQAALSAAPLARAPGVSGFSVEGFTGLEIAYAGHGTGRATIRLANTGDPGTAYTYEPGPNDYSGDVFFARSGRSPVAGNYDHFTVLHELGHALGLKHGNEDGFFGPLPEETDSMEFSVMTYNSYVGSDSAYVYNGPWGYAQTFMMYDIAALQYLYGADFTTNAGDTIYSWDPVIGATRVDGALAIAPGGNRIFQTIWDGGGTDTYDLSNYSTGIDLNLAPGGHSTFASDQRAYLGGGPNHGYARGNVFNALLFHGDPRSLIENAFGGAGDDRIVGNWARNTLKGNAGDDVLYGCRGADLLDGGPGQDRMYGGRGNDTYVVDNLLDLVVERAGAGTDTVRSGVSLTLPANLECLVLTGRAAEGSGNWLGNSITGNAAANTLRGRGGDDVLEGRGGADVLVGGAGDDIFRFRFAADSHPGSRDVLRGFQGAGDAAGDRIDVAGIDADPSCPGNQDFILGGGHAIGHLWLLNHGTDTILRGNVGGGIDLALVIEDGATLAGCYTAADFIGVV